MHYKNGRFFTGEMAKGHVYYGARKNPTGKGQRIYIAEDAAFVRFDQRMSQVQWTKNFAAQVIEYARKALAYEVNNSEQSIRSLESKLSQARIRKAKLIDLYLNGDIDRDIFLAKQNEIEKTELRLDSQLNLQKKDDKEFMTNVINIAEDFMNLPLIYENANRTDKAKILKNFTDDIIINSDKNITIKYSASNKYFITPTILKKCQADDNSLVRHPP